MSPTQLGSSALTSSALDLPAPGAPAAGSPVPGTPAAGAGRVAHTVIESPIGPLTLVATDGVLSALYMDAHRHQPAVTTFGEVDRKPFGAVVEQLGAYFAGELTRFDLPLALVGTPFRQTVWKALQDIPYGETESYGALAARIGNPAASRAVGLANGRNPISIIVPCHRVVGANGSMTGYGGGIERKTHLLALERRVGGHALL